jgi:hypothetical protein
VFTLGATEAYTTGDAMYRTIVAGDRIGVLPTYDGNVYGASKIGSSKLPANTPFRVHYYKKSGSGGTRDICINIEGMVFDWLPDWIKRILSYKFNASCRVHDLDYRAPAKYTQYEADRRFLDNMLKQAGWNPFWIMMAYAYYWMTRLMGWMSWNTR